MQHIDVHDLPEPVAQAIDEMVKAVRRQLGNNEPLENKGKELPRWEGQVIGTLTREEVYDDPA